MPQKSRQTPNCDKMTTTEIIALALAAAVIAAIPIPIYTITHR